MKPKKSDILAYWVAYGCSRDDLEADVMDKVKEGYRPIGGVITNADGEFFQAMTIEAE